MGELVLAGPLDASLARPRIRVAASPDERALAELYRGAAALVFPSVGEGLGLPVLEALACGTPVIATDLEPVRELVGDAALALVAPDDAAALTAAIERAFALSADERASLAARGLARAAAYSLDAMAVATVAAWDEALG
jgi:glycosyltransferase involved in cell wall biosynthesis